jgi:predicted nucleic acid-binding protein
VIVVDASALADVLLRFESARDVEERVLDPHETLHAPYLIDVEILNVLRRFARQGEWHETRAAEALADFELVHVVRHPHEPFRGRIWEMRDNVTAYDAAYLALAETLKCPLVTRDKRLAKAPGHGAKVEVM